MSEQAIISRAEAARRLREKRKSEGLCPICGLPVDNSERIVCSECTERISEQGRLRRMQRREKGLCLRCGGVVEDADRVNCRRCRSAYNTQMKAWFANKKKIKEISTI